MSDSNEMKPEQRPLDNFKRFVGEILTVSKDEVKKLEEEERRVKDALREQVLPDDAEPC
jgi:hypothetical protein